MGVIGVLNKEGDLKVDHPEEVRMVHLGVLTWVVLAVHTEDLCTACLHQDSVVHREWADLPWEVHTEARLWVAHLQDLCLLQVSCESSNFNRLMSAQTISKFFF